MGDQIYRMSDCDNIYIKSAGVYLPTLFEKKQTIFFVHDLYNLATNINKYNEKFDHLKWRSYYNGTSKDERKDSKKAFKKGVKFLFSTTNMYDSNKDFKNLVHDQIESQDIWFGL